MHLYVFTQLPADALGQHADVALKILGENKEIGVSYPPLPQKNPSAAPHSAAEGNLTASNLYPDPGSPYSPSSYATLPAQMVYFTFP